MQTYVRLPFQHRSDAPAISGCVPSSRRLLRREPQFAQQLVRLGPVNPGHPFIDVLEYRASMCIIQYPPWFNEIFDWYIDLQWFTLILTLIHGYLQKMILLAPCHEKDTRFQQRCAATKIGRLCLHSGTIKRRPIPNHPRNTGSKIP